VVGGGSSFARARVKILMGERGKARRRGWMIMRIVVPVVRMSSMRRKGGLGEGSGAAVSRE
jgi:hypothetical protein